MKKTIKKEVRFCDKCGKEDSYPTACLACGTEMCYDCQTKHGVSYSHAVHFQGSGDGFYCKPCDAKLTARGSDKQHNAYLAIKALRDEEDTYWANFKKRAEAAEAKVKSFL